MGKQVKVWALYKRVRWVFVIGGYDTEAIELSIKEALVSNDEMYLTIARTILESMKQRQLDNLFEKLPNGWLDVEKLSEGEHRIPQPLYPNRFLLMDTYSKIENLYALKKERDEIVDN